MYFGINETEEYPFYVFYHREDDSWYCENLNLNKKEAIRLLKLQKQQKEIQRKLKRFYKKIERAGTGR